MGELVRPAVEEVLVGVEAEGDGRSVAGGGTLAEGLGGGSLGEGLGGGSHAGGESMTTGAARATGGVRLVDPTTNWTVASTAVTLVTVHDSHMSK
ncbi:hypothetical protein ACFWUQ_03605 [Streptomyces sp. NPDC058662]|uniref:hypothetical protein n=1 Tax=Streptomyces sp. NPDC058662 TaxID=3346583 RepID=UPI003652489B